MAQYQRSTVGGRTGLLLAVFFVAAIATAAGGSLSAWSASANPGAQGQGDGPIETEGLDELTMRARYLSSEPLVEPEQLTESDLEHIRALRRTYGLFDDPEFVSGLYSSPAEHDARRSPIGILSSIAYTPQEEDQVYRRALAEWVGYQADLLAAETVGNYAATVIEPDGSISILCAPCNDAEIQSVQTAVDEESDIRGLDVEYSAAELGAAAAEFSAQLDERDIAHGGAILSGENRIVIYVSDEDAAEGGGVRVPPGITVDGGYEVVEPDVNKDDPIVFSLVEGGQYIVGVGGQLTSGFAVEGAFGPFMLSAGHIGYPNECTHDGKFLYQAGIPLGKMTAACQYGGDLDGALITTYTYRNNWGRVHYTSTNWSEPVTFGVSSHNLVNQTVCQTGRTTTGMSGNLNITNRCGTVSSTSSKSPCAGASPAWTYSLGAASYFRAGGDSEPLWYGRPSSVTAPLVHTRALGSAGPVRSSRDTA